MSGADDALATRVRLPDGRIFDGPLAAHRHRRIQLGMLHADSDGYVELAAGRRPPGGGLRMTTRSDPAHYLHGGHCGADGWLDGLLALAARHVARGEEVFVAPAVRRGRGASKAHVAHTRWLWIDVDGRDGLPAVRELLRRKAPQLVISSGGSGGVHVYWRLRSPLTGDRIERAHERLIYALGWTWRDGRAVPTVADRACKDRSRVMRLAGTVNAKSGAHARIAWANLALAPWSLTQLVGDLRDAPRRTPLGRRPHRAVADEDAYKRIAPAEYFQRLTGVEVPAHGLVSCPSPAHADANPSCHVGRDAGEGWCCHGCGAAGAIYDLASVLLGGPTAQSLRGDEFRRARQHVAAVFGPCA